MSIRTKRAKVFRRFGSYYDWRFPANPYTGDNVAPIISVESTVDSISNPRVNGKYRSGGPFFVRKYEVQQVPLTNNTTFRSGLYRAYVGCYTSSLPGGVSPPSWFLGDTHKNNLMSDMKEDGARGWARARPTSPDFSMATSLYELREVPGMLKDAISGLINRMKKHPKHRNRSTLSKTAEWHLAIQFGWLPLLRDVQSFCKAQKGAQKRLSQLIRDEGKPIRRRRRLKNRVNTEVQWTYQSPNSYNGDMSPTHVTQCYGGPKATTECTAKFIETRWCVGRFRYHLPPGPKDVKWKARMLRRIMGLRVTPSAVYNAMPWTWLADYFTGFGDFVDAVSGGVEDRLAADYFYVMETQQWTTTTLTTQGIYTSPDSFGQARSMRIDTWVLKARVQGSPFGFGVKDVNLSPMQWSILGALGLSRLP